MEPLYLGVDIGTSVAKGSLINGRGDVLAYGVFHRRHSLHSGKMYEHDANTVWWNEFKYVVRRMLTKAKGRRKDIRAVAITGMIPNICPLDRNGSPTRKAILYYDPRAELIETRLDRELVSGKWQNQVLSKLLWLRENEQSGWKTVKKILSTHSYIVFKLTGNYSVDSVTALEFGNVFDRSKMGWNDGLLEKYGLGAEIFPKVFPPAAIVGEITREASKETGLQQGIAVSAGTTDTISSLVGCGLRSAKELLIYYGTYSCAAMLNSGIKEVIFNRRIEYPIEWVASIPRGGQQLFALSQLFCDSKRGNGALQELDREALKSAPGANGVLFVQTLDLAVSTESTEPEGAILNLGMSNTKADICRALLEAFGYGLRYFFQLRGTDFVPSRCFAGGGGARSRTWRQIVSDITGIEQHYTKRSKNAFGTSVLAAVSDDPSLFGTITAGQLNEFRATRPSSEGHEEYFRQYRKYLDCINKFSVR